LLRKEDETVTQLQALGGLRLESSTFTRPKPLLLLAYLALEGTQQRKHLAELFWREGNRMKSLSMAFTLLRQGAGDVAQVDAKQAKTNVKSDVRELLEALDQSDWTKANELYTGVFLEGIVLDDWSSELEEWVYQTREYLAERVQYGLLELAEGAAKKQDFEMAATFAERACKLPGLGGTEVANIKRLYTLLCAGSSLLAPEVRKEAESYGVTLQLTTQEARATFKQETKLSNALPMRGTSFVGRDVELTELATLLNKPNVSLLTLFGTAGVGKTRLALQLAHEQQKLETFKDGVYFVALESLTDASLIHTTLLNYLGLGQQGKAEPLEQLTAFFGDKHILLVLDNFEHLVSGAMLVSLLLGNCPNLKVLVTSRETLKLEEENIFALEGLPTPQTSSDDAKLSDAVQLFKERAQQVQPHFGFNEQLPYVIRICQLLEGLPLGIELAASWVRIMSCAEIANEIERGLELLSSTAQNIPERHRSLRAAFEYSWNLLSPKEQEVLRKLAVFRGGFRREAASEVAGATIPVLASLVDKSLIRVLPTGRYDFHPLLQQFAGEKLAKNGEEKASVEDRHGNYYLKFLETTKQNFREGKQEEALRQLDEEIENAFRAWQWESDVGHTEKLLASLGAFKTFFTQRGRNREGEQFFAAAIKKLDAAKSSDQRLLAHLLSSQAWSHYDLGNWPEATTLAKQGLELAHATDDTLAQFSNCNVLACVLMDKGEHAEAKFYSQESLHYARASNDIHLVIAALNNLGGLENELEHLGEAEKYYREALKLCRETKDFMLMTSAMNNLGFVLKETHRLQEATRLLEESLAMSRSMNLRPSQMYAVVTLAMIYDELGQIVKSIDYARAGLEIAKLSGATMQQTFIEELLEKIQGRLEVV
jgi:predicted ATPase